MTEQRKRLLAARLKQELTTMAIVLIPPFLVYLWLTRGL